MPLIFVCGFSLADEPNPNHFLNTDVFELEFAADPQISPDGSRVIYVRRSNDIMMEYDRFKLLVYFANMMEVLDGQRGLRTEFRWIVIPRGLDMPDFVNLARTELLRGLVDVGARLASDPSSWNEGEPEVEWLDETFPVPQPMPTVSEICPGP